MSNRPEGNKGKSNTTLLIMGIIFLFTPLAFLGIIFLFIYFASLGNTTNRDIILEMKRKLNEEMNDQNCEECEELYDEINYMLEKENINHNMENNNMTYEMQRNINNRYFNRGGAIKKVGLDNYEDGPIKYK